MPVVLLVSVRVRHQPGRGPRLSRQAGWRYRPGARCRGQGASTAMQTLEDRGGRLPDAI